MVTVLSSLHRTYRAQAFGALLWLLLVSQVQADVIAPQAPPELSDTLTDFRTKEQLSESTYIEGKVDPQNSLDVPVIPGDKESKVLRMSANYQAQYEIAVPRYGASIVRFYDLRGTPMEIISTRLENQGFLAEVTASPSELLIRQFQGASTTLLQVKLKNIPESLVFVLKPLILVNQQSSVRTLLTSMTVNYFVDGVEYIPPKKQNFALPNPNAKRLDFSNVDKEILEKDLLEAIAIAMPLNETERKAAKPEQARLLDKIKTQNTPSK